MDTRWCIILSPQSEAFYRTILVLVILGLILLVVPGLIARAVTAVSVPVVMVEQLGYSKAVGRSRVLARGNWRHALGVVSLTWGIVLVLIMGTGFVTGAR